MNIDAFRCMQRGVQLYTLSQKDSSLLAPINQRSGKKDRALLLLHGFSSSPAVFRHFMPFLSSCYDAILCPALLGHADSLEAFAAAKGNDWYTQAEENCKLLVNEFEQVDVMGLSLGGLLACHLSSQFNLHHLYLLAPALDLQFKLSQVLKLVKVLNWLKFSRIKNAAGNLYASQHCEIAYRQLPLTSIIEMLNLVQQFQFKLPTCPTDLFLGCHDKVVASWRVADRFADKTNINIHWLTNSAHVLPLDADIEKILACIKQDHLDESYSNSNKSVPSRVKISAKTIK